MIIYHHSLYYHQLICISTEMVCINPCSLDNRVEHSFALAYHVGHMGAYGFHYSKPLDTLQNLQFCTFPTKNTNQSFNFSLRVTLVFNIFTICCIPCLVKIKRWWMSPYSISTEGSSKLRSGTLLYIASSGSRSKMISSASLKNWTWGDNPNKLNESWMKLSLTWV